MNNKRESYNLSELFNKIIEPPPSAAGLGNKLYVIGRPCVLPEVADKDRRVTKFLRSKMTVIDLIPCWHKINVQKIVKKDMSGIIPEIDYDKAIHEFSNDCYSYGLKNNYIGIRMYTTDDSTASDSISNNRGGKNYFQDYADKLYNKVSPISTFTRSVGLSETGALEKSTEFLGKAVGNMTSALGGLVGVAEDTQAKIKSVTENVTRMLSDSAIKGYRYSFPSIWNDASYQPNLSSRIRLVSPYGHPDAIRKFIIEPLMYLIILAGPKTSDGIAYGRPWSLTISAYGMSYVPLGSIRNITLNRGGSSTSFNIYRQPLTIDVSIQYDPIVGGFATFKSDAQNNQNKHLLEDSNQFIDEFGRSGTTESPTLATLSHIVHSLRPIPADSSIESYVFFDNKEHEKYTDTINTNVHRGSSGEDKIMSLVPTNETFTEKEISISAIGSELYRKGKEISISAIGSELYRKGKDVKKSISENIKNVFSSFFKTLNQTEKKKEVIGKQQIKSESTPKQIKNNINFKPSSNTINNSSIANRSSIIQYVDSSYVGSLKNKQIIESLDPTSVYRTTSKSKENESQDELFI